MSTPAHNKTRTRSHRTKDARRAGERIFDVAADLFYRQSIRSVGIETIVKQADVSKISLYRNFDSKDDLIVAYLDRRNSEYWHSIDRLLSKERDEPRVRLGRLIDHVARRTTSRGYRGCPFINYTAEFPEASHPGHRVVERNKREMRKRLLNYANAIRARNPQQLADSLFLLIEGAYASSQTLGGEPAAALAAAADVLIDYQTGR